MNNYNSLQAASIEALFKEKFGPSPLKSERTIQAANADQMLEEQFAGQYVAYQDFWNNDQLDRIVVASGSSQEDLFENLETASAVSDIQIHFRFVFDSFLSDSEDT